MQNKLIHLIGAVVLLIGLVGVIAGCNTPTPQPTTPPQATTPPQPTTPPQATAKPAATSVPATASAPAADGASLVESRCTVCHNLDRVKRGGKNKDQWTATVANMVSKGTQLTSAERTIVIDYLSKTYP